jgi:hypothetical protein
MKHLTRAVIAVFMAVLMGTLLPVQVFADTPDYISEVKVFMGDYSAAESEGYTLLKDGSNPVDLNQDAGGSIASKGEKAVFLGYKTTKKADEAITDLALMNMKGGYDVAEYDALYNRYINAQMMPFVQTFLATINEYRANYVSKKAANKARAQYIHDTLNKFIDDDTGKGLGDLLLNETIFEMAKPQYDALSDKEKEKTSFNDVNERVRNSLSATERKEHADLLTILAQGNGNATLLMQNLLMRAADSNNNTWMDRMSNLSYDDLLDQTGLSPTDAKKKVAKLYDDTAQTILDMWGSFSEEMNAYDENVEAVEAFDFDACQQAIDAKDTITEKTSEAEKEEILNAFVEAVGKLSEITAKSQAIAVHDALEEYDYLDGTMLDFFMQSAEELEDDITILYPMAAALTSGQKAGLDIVSLRELCIITLTDGKQYKNIDADFMDETSVFDGVDRRIYEKGGVALTSDSLRKDALAKANESDSFSFSWWTYGMMGVTVLSAAALFASVNMLGKVKNLASEAASQYEYVYDVLDEKGYNDITGASLSDEEIIAQMKANNGYREVYNNYNSANSLVKSTRYLVYGITAVMVIMIAVTTWLTWRDMCAYYDVKFSPIPHYMVEEKDIVGYNSKGEKIMLKNQSAYYKAVECNRTEADEMFKTLGTCADMNGDVGQQWLALYAVKNEAMNPILASSLKVVVDDAQMPAGYTTGVHMFGTDAAFNLNSSLYDWNDSAPATYIYFKTDDDAPSTAGSAFMPSMVTLNEFGKGTVVLAAGGGLILGAAITAIASATVKKKKENKNTVA